MNQQTARKSAVAEVTKWQETVARWEAEEIAASAELASLRNRMGDELLEDPSRLDSLSADMQKSERTVAAAKSAAAAAVPKLVQAQHVVLQLDAVAFDQAAKILASTLTRHRAKTDDLLEQLRQHEGEFVPASAIRPPSVGVLELDSEASRLSTWTRSAQMETEVAQLTLKAAVLRAVIAGQDPNTILDPLRSFQDGTIHGLERSEYFSPAIWGPDAIVQSPSFTARVAAKRQAIADHDVQAAFDPSEHIAELEAEIAKGEAAIEERRRRGSLVRDYQLDIGNLKNALAETIAKRDGMPAVRAQLVAELEELTGQSETVEV
jgi:hypothetical protein